MLKGVSFTIKKWFTDDANTRIVSTAFFVRPGDPADPLEKVIDWAKKCNGNIPFWIERDGEIVHRSEEEIENKYSELVSTS